MGGGGWAQGPFQNLKSPEYAQVMHRDVGSEFWALSWGCETRDIPKSWLATGHAGCLCVGYPGGLGMVVYGYWAL